MMKKADKWEKPGLGVLARSKSTKNTGLSRSGGRQSDLGPLTPLKEQTYLGPLTKKVQSCLGPLSPAKW